MLKKQNLSIKRKLRQLFKNESKVKKTFECKRSILDLDIFKFHFAMLIVLVLKYKTYNTPEKYFIGKILK